MVRLVSQTDGGVVEITWTAAAASSMLSTAIGEESEGVGEVALPASAVSIALAAKWMTHKADGSDGEAEFLESAQAESSLFASLVSIADFLALDGLLDLLLCSFGTTENLQAAVEAVPQLPTLLVGRLRMSDETAVSTLLEAANSPETLTWEQLEQCDGKFLSAGETVSIPGYRYYLIYYVNSRLHTHTPETAEGDLGTRLLYHRHPLASAR